jgi:hypothetical protein
MVAQVVGTTMESSGFSPCVSQMELQELESGFEKLEILYL